MSVLILSGSSATLDVQVLQILQIPRFFAAKRLSTMGVRLLSNLKIIGQLGAATMGVLILSDSFAAVGVQVLSTEDKII